MTKIQCLMCIVHIYLSVRDEQFFLNAGTLCTYRLVNDTQTSIYSHVHIYTWLKRFLYCLRNKYGCMFFDIDIDTHTRAFKVQNLTSAKSFTPSRLDFLPELGYVYICYSILKPSNYVLSCTPSHTLAFIWLLWLHHWKLALCTPHNLIFTWTS